MNKLQISIENAHEEIRQLAPYTLRAFTVGRNGVSVVTHLLESGTYLTVVTKGFSKVEFPSSDESAALLTHASQVYKYVVGAKDLF